MKVKWTNPTDNQLIKQISKESEASENIYNNMVVQGYAEEQENQLKEFRQKR